MLPNRNSRVSKSSSYGGTVLKTYVSNFSYTYQKLCKKFQPVFDDFPVPQNCSSNLCITQSKHSCQSIIHLFPQTLKWHLASQHPAPIILKCSHSVPSVLWLCWLGRKKGIRPVKTEWWGTGVVICLERGPNDLHMAQLVSLPPHHLLLQ